MKKSESTFGTSKSCLKCFFWKGKRTGDSGKVECDINECGLCEIDKKKHANDAYDAMMSNRSYRKMLPVEKVKSEIMQGKGTQFDPQIADIMLELIDEGIFNNL